MRNVGGIESPGWPARSERAIAAIAEGTIGCDERRKSLQVFADLPVHAAALGRGRSFLHVEVLGVEGMRVYRDQILVAVQIHVEEYNRPSPIARVDPGEIRQLGKGPVAPAHIERITADLIA